MASSLSASGLNVSIDQQFKLLQNYSRKLKDQFYVNLCVDAVIRYLSNPSEKDSKPTSFALAPEQVANTPLEIEFFELIIAKINNMPPHEKQQLLENFKILYPSVFKFMIDEETQAILKRTDPNPLDSIIEKLQASVIGQTRAVHQTASILLRQIHTETPKNECFLFVGPSGVGKTELAIAVGRMQRKFIKFDMAAYASENKISDFFGSSAGLSGSLSRPHFAEKLDETSPDELSESTKTHLIYEVKNVVILFDEFEKAHTIVRQSLLAIFDKWKCSMSYTQNRRSSFSLKEKKIELEYRFKNCTMIGTSNLFQQDILSAFEKGLSVDEIEELFRKLNQENQGNFLTQTAPFSSELLGRMKVIPFGAIPKGKCYQNILRVKLNLFFIEVKNTYGFMSVDYDKNPKLLEILESKLYGTGVDLRRIQRYLSDIMVEIQRSTPHSSPNLCKKIRLLFSTQDNKLIINVLFYSEKFAAFNSLKSIILP